MEELLKQIADLRKTIMALESRITKLESQSSTGDSSKQGSTGTVTKTYIDYSYGGKGKLRYFVRLHNGKMGYLKQIITSEGNYTVGQTRKVADMFGYKYGSKTKREMLGFELVSKYGDGEWAVIGKNAVDANGVTYNLVETTLPYDPQYLKFAIGQSNDSDGRSWLDRYYTNKPLVVDPKWTPDEIAVKLLEFHNSLVKK